MGLEYLASRIRTANAPPRATWWPRHGSTSALFLSVYGRRTEANVDVVRSRMDAQAVEWDRLLHPACARGIMARHVSLEVALVEAAREGLDDYIERIGDFMISVAHEQAKDLAANVPGLPERQLRYLLMGHASLFIKRVKHAIAREDWRKCHAAAEANDLALAAFTMEWF